MHGYNFEDTPLWAGICMLPMTVGFLVAGPLSGCLSDQYGARPFATGGMLVAALASCCSAPAGELQLLEFAAVLFANGARDGPVRLAEPGRHHELAARQPPRRRRRHVATFQNSSMVLSIGIFFSLIILGLSSSLPATCSPG